MRLQLNQDSVIKEVRQTSAYASCSDPDHPENYRFVTATESDRPLLERFFSDSFTEICELLKHSLAEVVRHGGRIFLYLILPRTNRIPRSTILAALTGYLVDRVLSHWFAVVCPDKAEPYRTSANDRLTLLRRLLAPTPPPRTPSPSESCRPTLVSTDGSPARDDVVRNPGQEVTSVTSPPGVWVMIIKGVPSGDDVVVINLLRVCVQKIP